MIFILFVLGFIIGIFFLRFVQNILGSYDKIKLPKTGIIFWVVSREFLWKRYKPNTDDELKMIKNVLRTEYPALTMTIEQKQNVVLNHKTIKVSFGNILNRVRAK
jgi:hypothetical protein